MLGQTEIEINEKKAEKKQCSGFHLIEFHLKQYYINVMLQYQMFRRSYEKKSVECFEMAPTNIAL